MAGRAKQSILGDMFDEETATALRDAADDAAFPRVDEDIDTQYRCPCCAYEWSGNPKPPIGTDIEDGEEEG